MRCDRTRDRAPRRGCSRLSQRGSHLCRPHGLGHPGDCSRSRWRGRRRAAGPPKGMALTLLTAHQLDGTCPSQPASSIPTVNARSSRRAPPRVRRDSPREHGTLSLVLRRFSSTGTTPCLRGRPSPSPVASRSSTLAAPRRTSNRGWESLMSSSARQICPPTSSARRQRDPTRPCRRCRRRHRDTRVRTITVAAALTVAAARRARAFKRPPSGEDQRHSRCW